jgi:hypothetical protein
MYVNSLTISDNNIFAATYGGGVFLSTDNGLSWAEFNTGLTTSTSIVYTLAISGSNIFAGTYNYGVWKRPLSEVTDVEETNSKLPTTLSLEQNYPNPFNPSTTIKYTIPHVTLSGVEGFKVTLKVFDVLGREIETIVDGYYEAGPHCTLYIVNSTLPSGVYFYRLQAENYSKTIKMLYLK